MSKYVEPKGSMGERKGTEEDNVGREKGGGRDVKRERVCR